MQIKSVLYMVSGILFGLFVAALVWVTARNPSGEAVTLRPVPTEKPIVVQIAGAVPRPGVYALPEGARVQDLISAAGGFLAEADKEFINLARVLEDGERLDVEYASGFSPVIPTPIIEPVTASSDLVNINTAASFQLETLPGIGPTTAGKIIEYRDENGPFRSIQDIINVPGIGPGTYDRIKDLITVDQ